MTHRDDWMRQCIEVAVVSAANGGGPFGALVVRDGALVATGANAVTSANDPTAHAEVQAIRAACAVLGDYRLSGCELYASTEPCPMCLAAAYWARVDAVYYAATRFDAARAGFDDSRIYEELAQVESARSIPFRRILGEDGVRPFTAWEGNVRRQPY